MKPPTKTIIIYNAAGHSAEFLNAAIAMFSDPALHKSTGSLEIINNPGQSFTGMRRRKLAAFVGGGDAHKMRSTVEKNKSFWEATSKAQAYIGVCAGAILACDKIRISFKGETECTTSLMLPPNYGLSVANLDAWVEKPPRKTHEILVSWRPNKFNRETVVQPWVNGPVFDTTRVKMSYEVLAGRPNGKGDIDIRRASTIFAHPDKNVLLFGHHPEYPYLPKEYLLHERFSHDGKSGPEEEARQQTIKLLSQGLNKLFRCSTSLPLKRAKAPHTSSHTPHPHLSVCRESAGVASDGRATTHSERFCMQIKQLGVDLRLTPENFTQIGMELEKVHSRTDSIPSHSIPITIINIIMPLLYKNSKILHMEETARIKFIKAIYEATREKDLSERDAASAPPSAALS